jgi:hypothetical protein
VHTVSDVRQIEMDTPEPLVPNSSPFDDECYYEVEKV